MRWMYSITACVAILRLLWWEYGCAVAPLMHRGGIMVDSWAEVKADDKTVSGILAAFNRAEAALQAGKMDDLMGLYSQSYSYHGLTKQDLRKIWDELLLQHREFRSNHILSRIVAVPSDPQSAEITCTGSLWAVSKETGEPVNIDSWYGEVHYMSTRMARGAFVGIVGRLPRLRLSEQRRTPFFSRLRHLRCASLPERSDVAVVRAQ